MTRHDFGEEKKLVGITKKKKNPNNTSGRKYVWRGKKVGNENQDPN